MAESAPTTRLIQRAVAGLRNKISRHRKGSSSRSPTETPAGPESPASTQAIDAVGAASIVTRIYQLALDRTPSLEEVQLWVNEAAAGRLTIAQIVEAIADSAEAVMVKDRTRLLPDVSNGKFIQFCYESILQRSPLLQEMVDWDHRLRLQGVTREQLARQLFVQSGLAHFSPDTTSDVHDSDLIPWMGTDRLISIQEWKERAREVADKVPPYRGKTYAPLRFSREPRILVSAIASLYRGGDYIEQFLENITSQTIFSEHCELIIIDADSPENEYATISRYMQRFPNIVYHRASTRIGIYEAWNVGVRMARGKYLTNTNMDDLRRVDSFERQVEILEKFPFVDVTYQDFFYSFEGHASFDFSAAVDVMSELPIVTPYNLMQSNSPHNAPMWRQELHDDVGMFDESFRSAGDYDFWLRCVLKNKVFYKCNDPHVIYFVNPEGLSTQADTRGIVEARRITKMHGSGLYSRHLLSSDEQFVEELRCASSDDFEWSDAQRRSAHWRYAAAQQALRNYSIAMRTKGH